MKMIKKLNSILACGLLLMSIGFAFGQTPDRGIRHNGLFFYSSVFNAIVSPSITSLK